MNRLFYLKEAPAHEIEALKLYHRRMGRDAVWDILELLNNADSRLTQQQIDDAINRKNIGQDLRFLSFIKVIDRKYVDEESDHTYSYAISYEGTNGEAIKRYPEYNILECKLTNPDIQKEFIRLFKSRKRRRYTTTRAY